MWRDTLYFREYLEMDENRYDSLKVEIPLPKSVHALSDLFAQAGASLLVAGGAVRDFGFHHFHGDKYDPKDFDVATEAPPKKVLEILNSPQAKSLGIKAFPKGEAFGVISAVIDGEEYEIATFREDWYDPESGDGRRPDQVSFSTPAKDAQRRDLTMNALFYDIQSKEIRDYNLDAEGQGIGLKDIRDRIARPVGKARDRFREDKLRIPRLVRFFSRFNPGDIMAHLDQDTLAAIDEFKHLAGVSPERIANEFIAGLGKAKNPANYVMNYYVTGLMPAVFPGLNVRKEEIAQLGNSRNIKVVLAWLFRHENPKVARQRLNQMKYPNDVADAVAYLLKLHKFDDAQVAPMLKQRDLYKQLEDEPKQQAAWASQQKDVKDFGQVSGQDFDHFMSYQPTVRSQDFMHLQGKAISDAMSAAEAEAYRKSRK